MRCDVCDRDGLVVLVPVAGSGLHFICLDCIEQLGMFCGTHQLVHHGYADGTSACHGCIIEDIIKNQEYAAGYAEGLREKLPREEFSRLQERVMRISIRTGQSLEYCVLVFMAVAGRRFDLPLDMVFDQVLGLQNVDLILPDA